MKHKILNGIIISIILALAFACQPKSTEPEAVVIDKEQIKKEIQAKEDGFADVYNARELKNIGYYAEDAVSYSQNKEPLIGRDAIVAYYSANLDAVPAGNKMTFTTNEVFVSKDGNQVVEIGYFKIVDATDTIVNSGHYMSYFEKRDGKYVCVRDMSVSDIQFE